MDGFVTSADIVHVSEMPRLLASACVALPVRPQHHGGDSYRHIFCLDWGLRDESIKVQLKFDAAVDSIPQAWKLVVIASPPDALESAIIGPIKRFYLSLFMVVNFSFCTLLADLLATNKQRFILVQALWLIIAHFCLPRWWLLSAGTCAVIVKDSSSIIRLSTKNILPAEA